MRKKSFWKFLILCLVLVVIAGASAKILLSDNDVSNGAITDIEGQTVVTVNEISIAIPNDWYDKIIVNPEENFYMTDQTLFGIFHADTYKKEELGWIFSICRYIEDEYEEKYLQSESQQYVFAKDDSSYYCVLLPTDMQSEDQAVNEFMERVRTDEIGRILDDMINRNGLSKYSGNNVEE
jgi:hypothetical protein